MKFINALGCLVFFSATLSNAAPTLDKRATTFCGQYESVTTGTYVLYNNLWGRSAATSGSQCTTLTSNNDETLAWSTSWSWAGGQYNVKSYANAVVNMSAKKISALKSIPTTWKWSYVGQNMVANVAYDLFTSSTASGSSEYEIMIWLGAFGGAGPISSTGSPIATVTINNISWKLYRGTNGKMNVYSFVASSNATNFSGDLMSFINYLKNSWSFPTSQFLKSTGAGTEPFLGSDAKLTTSAYKITVN